MGEIRKQLDFSGDVMNSTARLAGSCGLYGTEILISDQFYETLPGKTYVVERIADAELKGKTIRMNLIKINGRQ